MIKYLSAFFIVLALAANAQISCVNYNASNSGLPYNTVYAVTTDNAGNVWVGTDGGLTKFDGTNWVTYTEADGLPASPIRSLYCSPDGMLWIGTFYTGFATFDGTGFTIYDQTNSALPDDFVKAFAYEAPGIMWIGTSGGLARLKNDTITPYDLSGIGLFSNHIAALAVKPNGVKVIGFINGGFAYYNDTTFTFYNHAESNLPDNTVLSLALDSLGNVYGAMPTGGIFAHYGGNVWQLYSTTLNPNQLTNSFKVVANSPTGMWAGSIDKGMFHKTGITFEQETNWTTDVVMDTVINALNIPQSAFQNHVFSAWVGTENGGLYRLETATGIAETTIDNTVAIHFSDSRSQMIVSAQSPIEQVALYTIDGRWVAGEGNVHATKTAVALPVLSQGQYIMRCVTTKGVAVKKFWMN